MFEGDIDFKNLNEGVIGFVEFDIDAAPKLLVYPEVGDSIRLTINDAVYNLTAYEPPEDFEEVPEGGLILSDVDPAGETPWNQLVEVDPPDGLIQIAVKGENYDDDEHVESMQVKFEIL